ncbi:3-deoxy-7-phosphoheptulonate synthase [Lentisphaerota bacterium WC36G]|nr:3-deoxy-7-phosphoheptulonate synthase [Lentisphaerae bacterium WC36]
MLLIIKKNISSTLVEKLNSYFNLEHINSRVLRMNDSQYLIDIRRATKEEQAIIENVCNNNVEFKNIIEKISFYHNDKYCLTSRKVISEDTIVNIGGHLLGKDNFQIIAGPCAVESLDQMRRTAECLKENNVNLMRGCIYKPRTSPYDFQGIQEAGIEIMLKIKEEFDLAIVSEATSAKRIPSLLQFADCIQIGARNCQNFDLLTDAAQAGKPILFKRGMSTTVEEYLSATEYLLTNGCFDVVLCERGIKTFDNETRNCLDLGAVAALPYKTHLPIITDPSHATGRPELVLPLAKATKVIGAHGVMIETHYNRDLAKCDARQQLTLENFTNLCNELNKI